MTPSHHPEQEPVGKKPWRCRLFGHDWRDGFGWPVPDLVLGGEPEKVVYTCARCKREARFAFKPATWGL